MDRVRIPHKGWVVVCDGAKALVFRNDGDAELLNLQTVEVLDRPAPPTRTLGADRPGRARPPGGGARSALEEPDLHDEIEAAFLKDLVDRLDHAVRDHGVRSVVLVAAPRALGVLRKEMSTGLRTLLSAEIPKDLARLSTAEIEKHLAG